MRNGVALFLWKMRKLHLDVYTRAFVIDIGSGGNPHPMADVIVEKYLSDEHRLRGAQIDTRVILADACSMPFKNKAFGYSLAFHILEHMRYPEKFLLEVQRISHAGYIETPNALYECIHPFDVHLSRVLKVNDALLIEIKSSASDDHLLDQSFPILSDKWSSDFFRSNPRFFHVCFKWKNIIKYSVLNPKERAAWFIDPEISNDDSLKLAPNRQPGSILLWLRKLLRQVKLKDILCCPACQGELNHHNSPTVCECKKCGNQYQSKPIFDFRAPIN